MIDTVDGSEKRNEKTPILDTFGKDLTALASQGKLDPVIGRDKEIIRIAQILTRRKKNNPVLIGDPGIGKSQIVAGLAMRIYEKKAPRTLLNKRIIELEPSALVAGTKYRGQLEERVKVLLAELAKSKDIILFIDEIHTIMGAGGQGLDVANMFKPALARGDMQCIGATTLDEYRESIEKDGAMERRFQKVVVNEPSAAETLIILNNIKGIYEDYHNVKYTDEAIKACVNLSVRYLTDRFLPDKAIDLLDESGSKTQITGIVIPKDITKLENDLLEIQKEKMRVVKTQEFELAAKIKKEEDSVKDELNTRRKIWQDSIRLNKTVVNDTDIVDIISIMTDIPLSKISETENQRLLNIENDLNRRIIGQPEAISKLSKAIKRTRAGIKNPNKPSGVFLFIGPTGVGKSQLTKAVNDYLFEGKDNLIRVDMNEYSEKFNQSRLIGSPPGYVGYDEGGELTEKVRRKPYSVVLFDEVEKAHPDIFNLLLRTFDEGFMTDASGRKVDFRNTIMIMTSNLGTREVREQGMGIGFTNEKTVSKDKIDSTLMKELKKFFKPEFLNRLDDIIVFNPLEKEHIYQIFDVEILGLKNRVSELGYILEISDKMKDFVVEEGYDSENGARPLKRSIERNIEDTISEEILKGEIREGDTIYVDYVDNSVLVSLKKNDNKVIG
jgi:ATP-dependent Clp protease ATP-binding subunit ClpC